MIEQPPPHCPVCKFPSFTVGMNDDGPLFWVTCVSCCAQRKDWEDYLNQTNPPNGG